MSHKETLTYDGSIDLHKGIIARKIFLHICRRAATSFSKLWMKFCFSSCRMSIAIANKMQTVWTRTRLSAWLTALMEYSALISGLCVMLPLWKPGLPRVLVPSHVVKFQNKLTLLHLPKCLSTLDVVNILGPSWIRRKAITHNSWSLSEVTSRADAAAVVAISCLTKFRLLKMAAKIFVAGKER